MSGTHPKHIQTFRLGGQKNMQKYKKIISLVVILIITMLFSSTVYASFNLKITRQPKSQTLIYGDDACFYISIKKNSPIMQTNMSHFNGKNKTKTHIFGTIYQKKMKVLS